MSPTPHSFPANVPAGDAQDDPALNASRQARGLAHDLNNVLTSMLSAVNHLRSHLHRDRAAIESVEDLEEGIHQVIQVAKRLAEMAATSAAGRGVFEPGALVTEVSQLLRDTLPRNIELREDIAANLPGIRGDPTRMFEVMMNLCLNARDAMPDGGTMALGAELDTAPTVEKGAPSGLRTEPHVVLSVRDTGVGMSPEVQSKLFTLYFTTKTDRKGAGQGLSKSLAVVRALRGGITIRSMVGRGTVARVFLPAAPRGEVTASAPASAEDLRGRGEMVLLVDDDPSVLAICKAALQQFGYQVVTSEDGRAAVAAFSEHRKDIQAVVTDLCMPAMDGGQVASAVLRMKPSVKVIISSGYLDDAERDRLGGLGVHGFLAKPYRSAQLLQMLKETLASAPPAR